MIALKDVTKRYPDGTVAVGDLTMEMPTGEITVLVGVGLRQDDHAADDQPPDRADVAAASPSTAATSADADPIELRRGIGYVIQQVGLFPHRTVADNVATVPELLGWDKERDPRARRSSCSSWSGSTRRRAPTATRRSSPAASSSASASPAPSPPTRRCC